MCETKNEKEMNNEQLYLTKKGVWRKQDLIITYPQGDLDKFLIRENFQSTLETELKSGSGVAKLSYQTYCSVVHVNGRAHYHYALKETEVKK